eukprot:6338852-Amphidinium_carterae.1
MNTFRDGNAYNFGAPETPETGLTVSGVSGALTIAIPKRYTLHSATQGRVAGVCVFNAAGMIHTWLGLVSVLWLQAQRKELAEAEAQLI